MAAVQQQTTQLEFHQAMADFKTMFPDMDTEVIEAVLRANQGAVDATIDQLLAMSTDNENEKLRHEIERREKQVPGAATGPLIHLSSSPPSAAAAGAVAAATSPNSSPSHAAGAIAAATACIPSLHSSPVAAASTLQKDSPLRDLSKPLECSPARTRAASEAAGVPLNVLRGWTPALLGPLPDDFLRLSPLPWASGGSSATSSPASQKLVLSQQLLQQRFAENQQRRGALDSLGDPELDRYLEDERIALFLQNEEFMAELRWNKDFLSTLEKDHAADSPPEEAMGTYPFSKSISGTHDEDAIFKERIRNMGKMSKKKFAQLARVFTRSRKRGGGSLSSGSSAKSILSQGGPAPAHDNLLLNSEPLIEEDDEEEEDERLDEARGGEARVDLGTLENRGTAGRGERRGGGESHHERV